MLNVRKREKRYGVQSGTERSGLYERVFDTARRHRREVEFPVFPPQTVVGISSRPCKILKQFADRNRNESGITSGWYCHSTNIYFQHHHEGRSTSLSGSGAKFFLDSVGATPYNDAKFSGGILTRAKIHLHRRRISLNCRPYVWGRDGVSLCPFCCTRFHQAGNRKRSLARASTQQSVISGKTKAVKPVTLFGF